MTQKEEGTGQVTSNDLTVTESPKLTETPEHEPTVTSTPTPTEVPKKLKKFWIMILQTEK